MLQNTVKDSIKNALVNAGYSSSEHNLQLLYQLYMGGPGDGNFGKLVRENAGVLKR